MRINLLSVFSFIQILIISPLLSAQTDSIKKPEYYKVSEVRIFINDKSDITELRKQGLGIEHIKIYEKYFDALLDSFQIDILKKSGYPYEIIIDDVTKDYLERTKDSREKIKTKKPCQPLGFGYGSMGGFYTFSEVVAQLDTMRLLYPNLITVKDSIGASIEGRTIWAVKISDNPDVNESEPQVFYNALIHANEQQGMMTIIYFMYYLLENYGTNPEVTYLIDNRELYFVPVFNPDGYAYNEQISPNGGGMWRKNRRDNGGGIFGVDMARNFGYMWGYDNLGSSPIPSAIDYRGTGPFSEPESQTIREFCIEHNFFTSCTYHTFWNIIFPPWGYNLEQTPDSTTFNIFIALANSLNGYRNGIYVLPPENYPSNGDVLDWMYGETNEKNRIFGILPEVGGADDGGFWPPPENIIPLAQENLYSNFVYAWGPGIIENPPYISQGTVNPKFYRPMIDTLKITATEMNPDQHTSNAYAQILNLNDSLLSEIQLNKVDTIFTGTSIFNLTEEDFYKIRFKQSGIDIPSNLYSYGNNILRFTTAGPILIDSLSIGTASNNRFTFKPFLKNAGTNLTIENIVIKLTSNDPWVTLIFPEGGRGCPNLLPGEVKGVAQPFAVTYDSATFPGYFQLKFEIMSKGLTYWTDQTEVIVGVEDELNEVPTDFVLAQNYPNPFNPVTTIKYQIPHRSNVSLKIYDLLGNEVADLVNEEQEVGFYDAEFNAATLSSGIYFYRLQAGDFIQTKKMILLK